MGTHIVDLTAAFALILGTAAGVLALLNWRIFRESPVGRALLALALLLSTLTITEAVTIAFEKETLFTELLQSAVYTILVVFIALMIDSQRRMNDPGESDGYTNQ